MKKVIFSLAAALIALSFGSCDTERELENPLDRNNLVTFNANVVSVGGGTATPRMTGTTWTADDAIGVFAVNSGSPLNNNAVASNIRYTTPGTGAFTAAVHSEAIAFPSTGGLQFFAYYPFVATITNFTLPLDVSDQSDQSLIDVLYSSNGAGTALQPNVTLNFTRQMSQLVLNVTAGHGINDLTHLQVQVLNLATTGELNLANGAITPLTAGTINTVTGLIDGDVTKARSISILIPEQDLQTAVVRFSIHNTVWEWSPTTSVPMKSGFRYTYSFELAADGLRLADLGSNIADWNGDKIDDGTDEGSLTPLPPTAPFYVDEDKVSVSYTALAQKTVGLTAEDTQAWTAVSDKAWLTVTPSGIGSGTITFTADENTGAAREAKVTITATGTAPLRTIDVVVTQDAAPGAGPQLLFPGSDFNDWSTFTGSIVGGTTGAGVNESENGGRNGSGALLFTGTPGSTITMFTANIGNIEGKTTISFWVNGTSAGNRTISITLNSGTSAILHAFNLPTVGATSPVAATHGGTSPAYGGTMNTGGNWVQITMDISTLDLSNVARMQIRAGSATAPNAYNILIDDIKIE